MGLEELRKSLEEEIEGILTTDFKIEITETTLVPSLDDSGITYPNLETGIQKCKLIETCVLYIDLRKSTDLNLSHKRETMSKLYSTFIRSIMKSAGEYNGKVRNVVGDRVMILFDSTNSFGNAYKTAVLLNSVVSKLLDQHFKNNEVKAGIGIDYGKMLVTKAGIIKKGFENTNYKSLVWLGRPANVASKLTDLANKTITEIFSYKEPYIRECFYYPNLDNKYSWYDAPIRRWVKEDLIHLGKGKFKHKNDYFHTFLVNERTITNTKSSTHKPILMTEEVYKGVLKEASDMHSVKDGRIKEDTSIQVPGYSGKVYGVDSWFTAFE
ncbi:adenylate/guanylate cyclase domain-containing protein (plasmid) [Cytobacillus oceanisediminis]|uniref:adenylate/guanylate cyclase domain-containing protein n=1 Tax=Cytobacillus oceanisediminis TaxID=665099 RepID=UPI0018649FCA|nr:adenylate/guanylate cyclase domain-containing protein [Cytobacillus oceanisediminis]QOK30096.1 adenylate/guanylate cyclase domain-containing protein [Cytobacillus oceanisediminis]